ncbi:MAG: BNR-4 repeat-containing protein [Planctomycetota bacterium]
MIEAIGTGLWMGGTGGAYLLATTGLLVVDVAKVDLNVDDRATEMRILLVGPDRQVLQEVRIPDDGLPAGEAGPAQRVRLQTRVERPGVYAVNITVTNDPHGERVAWSLRTTCPRYLIEMGRGHRDRRHDEPIVLRSPDRPGDICWRPRDGEMTIAATDLPDGVETLDLYDAADTVLRSIPVRGGRAEATIEASVPRDRTPWRLHLPRAQATVQIDGLTRWGEREAVGDLCLWTDDPSAWFPLADNRWLLTPYSRTAYARPGETAQVSLQVRNDARAARTIDLAVEFSDGNAWPVALSEQRLTLEPHSAREVVLEGKAPDAGAERACHVRATPAEWSGFTTYSTVRLRGGVAPAERPLELPFIVEPYRHENEQVGYVPDVPTDWEIYVDLHNRPSVRTTAGVTTLRDGRWETTDLPSSPNRANTKIAWDRDNAMYLLATDRGTAALLQSTDGGRSFTSYDIGTAGNGLDIEQFTGHNAPQGPPAVVRTIRTDGGGGGFWRRVADLDLILFDKRDDGRLEVRPPVRLSGKALGVGMHSGLASSVVSRGSRVHVVWAEATDPDEDVPGVPTYVVTYDRNEGRLLGDPVLVGYGAPPNDVHNRPSITLDSKGILHVLTGTHGHPFSYTHSLEPDTAHGGWTEAETMGEGLSQTYIGMVCGPDDTLHLAYRLWRTGADPHPVGSHATLAYQRKRPGEPWSEPRVLVVAAFANYGVFYHRLTLDHAGRVGLSYDYWATYWFYRNDHPGRRRQTLVSPDGGDTWALLTAADLQAVMTEK